MQRSGYQPHARSVQRRIDHLEVRVALHALRGAHQREDGAEIGLIHLCPDPFRMERFVQQDVGGRCDPAHFGDDILVMRRGNLRPVGPKDLITVVFLGIVRSGDHDAGLAAQVADGERKLRRGADIVEDVGPDAVGEQHFGGNHGKIPAAVAAVVGDRHRGALGELLFQVVRQSLRGHRDGVAVHPVGAGAQHAAKSARTELQRPVEAVFQLFAVALEEVEHLFARCFVIFGPHPFGSHRTIIFFHRNYFFL